MWRVVLVGVIVRLIKGWDQVVYVYMVDDHRYLNGKVGPRIVAKHERLDVVDKSRRQTYSPLTSGEVGL